MFDSIVKLDTTVNNKFDTAVNDDVIRYDGWYATIRRGRGAGGRSQDLLAERVCNDIDDRRGGSHGGSARQPLQRLWRQGAAVPAHLRTLRKWFSRFSQANAVEPRSRDRADSLAQGGHRQLDRRCPFARLPDDQDGDRIAARRQGDRGPGQAAARGFDYPDPGRAFDARRAA